MLSPPLPPPTTPLSDLNHLQVHINTTRDQYRSYSDEMVSNINMYLTLMCQNGLRTCTANLLHNSDHSSSFQLIRTQQYAIGYYHNLHSKSIKSSSLFQNKQWRFFSIWCRIDAHAWLVFYQENDDNAFFVISNPHSCNRKCLNICNPIRWIEWWAAMLLMTIRISNPIICNGCDGPKQYNSVVMTMWRLFRFMNIKRWDDSCASHVWRVVAYQVGLIRQNRQQA